MIDRLSPTHRPTGWPVGYQRWHSLLFLHWPLPAAVLRPLVPAELSIDLYAGVAYVGLIPFVVEQARPAVPPPLGLDFLETNVRTYVHLAGEDPGVYFFSLDAASLLAMVGARTGFGLPYFPRPHADAPARRRRGLRDAPADGTRGYPGRPLSGGRASRDGGAGDARPLPDRALLAARQTLERSLDHAGPSPAVPPLPRSRPRPPRAAPERGWSAAGRGTAARPLCVTGRRRRVRSAPTKPMMPRAVRTTPPQTKIRLLPRYLATAPPPRRARRLQGLHGPPHPGR
jgi:hypothetical protein